jgi:hypothetical protein
VVSALRRVREAGVCVRVLRFRSRGLYFWCSYLEDVLFNINFIVHIMLTYFILILLLIAKAMRLIK